jgi:glycosyltransferase involved in cell wall biosynthesis
MGNGKSSGKPLSPPEAPGKNPRGNSTGKIMKLFYFARVDLREQDASQRHVLEFCLSFARLGHEVTLFIPDLGARPRFEGLRTVYVPTFSRRSAVTFFTFYIALFFVFLKHYRRGRPDVVYTRFQQMEWLVTWLRFVLPFRYAIEINGVTSVELKIHAVSSWIIRLLEWNERLVFRFAHLLVTPSAHIQEALQKNYGIGGRRFFVVSNGADPEVFKPKDARRCRQALGLDPDGKYLVFVGSFKKWPGIYKIVEVFPALLKAMPDCRLLLVGDGEERKKIEDYIAQNHLSGKIVLAGKMSYEKIPDYINAGDICLAPYFDSLLNESGISPLKMYEYMACGKPILTSPVGGVDVLFKAHRIGELIDSNSAEAWVPVITSLLGQPDKMREFGENGRRAVIEEYSWDAIAGRIAAKLESL